LVIRDWGFYIAKAQYPVDGPPLESLLSEGGFPGWVPLEGDDGDSQLPVGVGFLGGAVALDPSDDLPLEEGIVGVDLDEILEINLRVSHSHDPSGIATDLLPNLCIWE